MINNNNNNIVTSRVFSGKIYGRATATHYIHRHRYFRLKYGLIFFFYILDSKRDLYIIYYYIMHISLCVYLYKRRVRLNFFNAHNIIHLWHKNITRNTRTHTYLSLNRKICHVNIFYNNLYILCLCTWFTSHKHKLH